MSEDDTVCQYDYYAEIQVIKDQLAAATERNGNLAVELAAVKQERDAARVRAGCAAVGVEALKQERDALRREVDELAHIAEYVPCHLCNARDFCDNQPTAMPCGDTLRAWAKQQAAQAGKDQP